MDKRYIAVAAVLVVAAFAVFSYRGLRETQSGIEHPYKVYNGEEFLHDAYPYTFVFFGDNRPAEGKEQPKTFKNIIQKINNDNALFVIAFVASMYCGRRASMYDEWEDFSLIFGYNLPTNKTRRDLLR